MTQLIMLGTGSAMPTHSYNACFIIKTYDYTLLSDAGGGNGIFQQFDKADLKTSEITHIVVSHTHTDHIFGVVWLVRDRINSYKNGQSLPIIKIYANRPTYDALLTICRLTFLPSYYADINKVAEFTVIKPGDTDTIGHDRIEFFDVASDKVSQTGFSIIFNNGCCLVALGDEALTNKNSNYAESADYLISGAFCRYADREEFRPYEKHHRTVLDVAETAETLGVKNLILYHSEDKTQDKKSKYIAEASLRFSGNIIVPDDLDSITL